MFGKLYEKLQHDPVSKSVFLECLEPYILSDRLTTVAPGVMQAFVEHFQDKGRLQNVEACIVHMDIASLDLNQVIRIQNDK